jgi:tetratricopeptide (TPR) repeat protein
MELDEQGSIRVLDHSVWRERRRRLDELGGPPPADPAPRLDPILFGGDPSARGDALKQRGLWDRAAVAYAEAARARPLNHSVWLSLARMHIERGHPDRAAETLADAIRMIPDDPALRRNLGQALLWSGDRAGWRRSNTALLDRFGATTNARTTEQVAWSWMLGPGGTTDPEAPVRMAEGAIRNALDDATRLAYTKSWYLNTLGAALYRAGRFDEAIHRLEESIEFWKGNGTSGPNDWAFLAMAHHRLQHHAEAKRWLERLRSHQPSTDPAQFWDELEFRLLRSEAEAVVLYDPVFPDDPFAR